MSVWEVAESFHKINRDCTFYLFSADGESLFSGTFNQFWKYAFGSEKSHVFDDISGCQYSNGVVKIYVGGELSEN